MKCPADKHELVVASTESRTGWKCSDCSGVWLPKTFISTFHLTHPGFVFPFYEGLVLNTTGVSNLECPEGHGVLQQSVSREIELDWCKSCQGIWFDQGELMSLVETISEKKKVPFGWPHVAIELFIWMGILSAG